MALSVCPREVNMRKYLAPFVLVGLLLGVGVAPADASPVPNMKDTNWPCHAC